jgi:hypothetical protein
MAAEDIKINWGSLSSAITVTNLASLADGNLWLGAAINDTEPSHELVQISYTIEFNATPVAGDYLALYLPEGNGDGTILWPGGVSDSEQAISTAATKAAFFAATKPVWYHFWQTDHSAIFNFVKTFRLPAPNWRIAIRPVGEALKSSGHTIKYKYGTPQRQTS